MGRKRVKKSESLSPLLIRLIDAAEHAGQDADGRSENSDGSPRGRCRFTECLCQTPRTSS